MANEKPSFPEEKPLTQQQAVAKAKAFLRQQPRAKDFDEKTARVIESNECINVLFRSTKPHRPPEGMVSVNKLDGALEWIKLG